MNVWFESSSHGAGAAQEAAVGEASAPAAPPATRRSTRAKRVEGPRAQPQWVAAETGGAVAGQAAGEGSATTDSALAGGSAGAAGGVVGGVVGAQAAGASMAAHGPGLRALSHPCAGFFPASAHGDRGEVQIAIEVDREGHARASKVLVELPYGEGFGSAARACASHLSFTPAIDGTGAPIAGLAKLKLRFHRDSAS